MVPKDDARNTVEFDDYYVIKSAFRNFERRFNEDNCKSVPDDFEYNSGTNTQWLTIEQLQDMISSIKNNL